MNDHQNLPHRKSTSCLPQLEYTNEGVSNNQHRTLEKEDKEGVAARHQYRAHEEGYLLISTLFPMSGASGGKCHCLAYWIVLLNYYVTLLKGFIDYINI